MFTIVYQNLSSLYTTILTCFTEIIVNVSRKKFYLRSRETYHILSCLTNVQIHAAYYLHRFTAIVRQLCNCYC